jgi:hypothetical protein
MEWFALTLNGINLGNEFSQVLLYLEDFTRVYGRAFGFDHVHGMAREQLQFPRSQVQVSIEERVEMCRVPVDIVI